MQTHQEWYGLNWVLAHVGYTAHHPQLEGQGINCCGWPPTPTVAAESCDPSPPETLPA